METVTSFETVTDKENIYSSVNGTSSMLYNSNYTTNEYEATSINEESIAINRSIENAIPGTINNITSNPAYDDVRVLGVTDTTGYNHLYDNQNPPQIYGNQTAQKQDTSCKLISIAVVASIALVVSVAAYYYCAIEQPHRDESTRSTRGQLCSTNKLH